MVTAVDLPLVTFTSSITIGDDTLTSTSTLRFRGRAEIERDLGAALTGRARNSCSSPVCGLTGLAGSVRQTALRVNSS
jgi:hypothetical protein